MADYDPTDIAAQERAKEDRAAAERITQVSEEEDLRWLMSSKQGRRIIWKLLADAGVFQASFDTNSMKMAFAEGRRSYGNMIMGQVLKIAPELFPTMLKEVAKDGNGRPDDRNGSNSKRSR